MQDRRALFVLTGHDRLGPASDTNADRTGFHLAEAARPWDVLSRAGYRIDLVTPRGTPAPVDPSSRDLDDEVNAKFLNDSRVKAQLDKPRSLSDVRLSDYDAIYFPGGHGTMWDLPEDENVQRAVREMYEAGKVVGAVCHGPAALVNVKLSNGRYLVDDKTVSVFTDAEERAVEKEKVVPFLLASRLEQRGATLDKADNFEKAVSVDERLVTGQNPASARAVGEAMLELLEKRERKAA